MANERIDLPQGTLDLLILKTERRGWIKAHWAVSENNRRARYYELTRQGRKQLAEETEAWRKLTAAVEQVLEAS
jgi:DNA-binding PadR family transcriptional regulator